MPSLGPAEVLVILVIALLVFGPNKMPEVARQAGKAFQELRRVQQHLRSEISGAMSDLDGSASNADSTSAPSASGTGGDPVPMLPPRDPDAPGPAPGSDPATPEDGSDQPTPSSPPPADPA
jgi:sec-independent protein translocase protein TatA